MLLKEKNSKAQTDLPDIAKETRVELTGKLDRVGMSEIEVPVLYRDARSGELFRSPAKADAFVSLDDPLAKGIHMSRLFLALQENLEKREISLQLIDDLLHQFIASHVEISEKSHLSVKFDYLTQRPALKSENMGWRSYPVVFAGSYEKGQTELEFHFRVTYSSTCPCSAALARKLIQEQFRKNFSLQDPLDGEKVLAWLGSTQGIVATPHSQRSYADIKIKLKDAKQMPAINDLIDLIEMRLATPVQAAVKREDEQQFALLNGQNLMFCEDAARKIRSALMEKPFIKDFWARVAHIESLHPHDAVAVVTKGVAGGYKA